MKILIYGLNYAPELTGVGRYTGEMAAWLAHRGHDVRCVTAVPYYPTWNAYTGYRSSRFYREVVDGVRVLRCPLWVPKRPASISRIIHLLSFALTSSLPLLWTAWRWRPEIVWTVQPTFFCLPGALLASRLARAKACLHVQDIEIEAAFNLRMLPRFRLFGFFDRLHDRLLHSFDLLSTISPEMAKRLTLGRRSRPAPVICPNWVDVQRVRPSDRENRLRSSLGLRSDQVVALFAGNMGEKQGLPVVVDVARRFLGDARVVFLLAGDGAIRRRLATMADALPNIRFLPLQPEERRNELLSLADIHILPQKANTAGYAMPSKLAGMLASGRPVVAMGDDGSSIFKIVANCGLVVPPGDVAAMTAAVSMLVDDPDLRRRLGDAAREVACRCFDHEVILAAYESSLDAVLTREPPERAKLPEAGEPVRDLVAMVRSAPSIRRSSRVV